MQIEDVPFWENVHASRSWGHYPAVELVSFVGRNFGSAPDRSALRFLEIGCGQGANLWFIAREGFQVSGIDGSPSAIRKTIERFTAESLPVDLPKAEFRVGDFSALPWKSGTFDVVVDIEAIYANTLSTIESAIGEAYRVLKNGGQMFAMLFGIETTGYDTGELIEPGTSRNPLRGPCANHGISHFFSLEELQKLFAAFSQLDIGWVLRSDELRGDQIFEWIVRAKK